MSTYVTDDPASLRHAAGQLRHRAEVFLDVAAQVDATIPGILYVGTAGDTFRSAIGGNSSKLRTTCAGITALADRLSREADRIEQEQAQATSSAAYTGTYYD